MKNAIILLFAVLFVSSCHSFDPNKQSYYARGSFSHTATNTDEGEEAHERFQSQTEAILREEERRRDNGLSSSQSFVIRYGTSKPVEHPNDDWLENELDRKDK